MRAITETKKDIMYSTGVHLLPAGKSRQLIYFTTVLLHYSTFLVAVFNMPDEKKKKNF